MATPARLAPLTQEDREQLTRALQASGDGTKRLLGPLLALDPVQYLLLTFVKDASRPFEDHVWDPVTRDVLHRLRDARVDSTESHAQVSNVFEAALMQQATVQMQAGGSGGGGAPPLPTVDDAGLLAAVDTAQADGKAKFSRGDYYAALNAFKKSVAALLTYHEDQYYGTVIDPHEWEEEDLRQRYVTLCCNAAVCAIKIRDFAVIRLYATKALRVDDKSSKAIYALVKVSLLEQRFEEARAEAMKGAKLYQQNDQFSKLLKEIEAAELKQLRERADLLAIKDLREKVEEEERKRRAQEEAEKRARLERAAEVTRLPTLHDDDSAFQRLNIYFMRIKQGLDVTIDPIYNPDNGEAPLFECSMVNRSTGVALATGVTASSKKAAKQAAARVTIHALWKLKRDAGKLLPEDQEHWEAYETAQRDGTALSLETPAKCVDDESAVVPRQTCGATKAVQLTIYERQAEPAAILHQLTMQRRLQVEFTMNDVSPSKQSPLFACVCVVNGETLGTATAPGKKKAKADAAKLAMEAAVAKGIIQYVRTVTVVEDPQARGAESTVGTVGAEVA